MAAMDMCVKKGSVTEVELEELNKAVVMLSDDLRDFFVSLIPVRMERPEVPMQGAVTETCIPLALIPDTIHSICESVKALSASIARVSAELQI